MSTVDVVTEDLEFLSRTFTAGEVVESDLRRASVIVRRLLNDSQLARARNVVKAAGRLEIEAFPIEQVLPSDPATSTLLAMAGGCRYRRRQFGPAIFASAPVQLPDVHERRQYPLSDYLGAGCIVFQNERVTRRQLIKYMANKRGGAHFDQSRKPEERNLAALDRSDDLTIDGFRSPFLELLAAIQALVSSPSAMTPFGLPVAPTALFDKPTGRSEGPVQLAARARHSLDRVADGGPA